MPEQISLEQAFARIAFLEKRVEMLVVSSRLILWTTYDGTQETLPQADVTVLLHRFNRTGSLFCEAAAPCWFVHGEDYYAQLLIGDRWMPWPGGEKE